MEYSCAGRKVIKGLGSGDAEVNLRGKLRLSSAALNAGVVANRANNVFFLYACTCNLACWRLHVEFPSCRLKW